MGKWFLNQAPTFLKKFLILAKTDTLRTDIDCLIEQLAHASVEAACNDECDAYAADGYSYAEYKIFIVQKGKKPVGLNSISSSSRRKLF